MCCTHSLSPCYRGILCYIVHCLSVLHRGIMCCKQSLSLCYRGIMCCTVDCLSMLDRGVMCCTIHVFPTV
ncbi:hypothetical protein GDO81_024316 [Engystomops pustulosus]|uniref:Uncharacterized protein n=1 Tax=Engystomops pustulosus TaxID=76066 RepID=A0AAV6YRF3_ENGPU|nr:hypothetical protein GDO81_024316 [Engystomops pustulosus]